MQRASSWEELNFLVHSAGVSVEQALGLQDDQSQGDSNNESFRDNLLVHGVAEQPLQFQFSDPAELEVWGTIEPEEKPLALPPFLTLDSLLQPEYIPLLCSQRSDVCPDDEKPPISSLSNKDGPPREQDVAVSVEPKDSSVSRPYKGKRQDRDDSPDSEDIIDLTQD